MFKWLMRLWRRLFGIEQEQSGGAAIDVEAEAVDDLEDIDHHYENLVFEGGGVKGLALAAAVMELEKLGILDDIKRFAGSSAGAIVAAGLAIGYSPKEITKVMMKTNFSKFVDDSLGVVRDAARLVSDYGYAKGDYFETWVNGLIRDKTGSDNYTFKQLYESTGRELVITGTNLSKQRLICFSHRSHPDLPIGKAVRVSMSIPYFFVPVELEGDVYVDGGVLYNYPIDVFGEGNEHTLGLKMVTDEEKRTDLIQHGGKKIENLVDFSSSIIGLLLLEIERSRIEHNYWKRTITINTGHVSTVDFDLSKEDMKFLYKQGKHAVRDFFGVKPVVL